MKRLAVSFDHCFRRDLDFEFKAFARYLAAQRRHRIVDTLAQFDGFVICRRHPGLVQPGDCLAHVAVDFDVASL